MDESKTSMSVLSCLERLSTKARAVYPVTAMMSGWKVRRQTGRPKV